jgi:fructose-bisphosphate aldolase class I
MLFSSPGETEFINGVILQDETIRQKGSRQVPFAQMLSSQGIVPGIKVDAGAKPLAGFPEESVTEGRSTISGIGSRNTGGWALALASMLLKPNR